MIELRDNGYLSVDEKRNFMDSLEKARHFLDRTDEDPGNWKWFVIAYHHALYCLMLICLENSDQSGIRYEDLRDEHDYILTYDPKTNRELKLISFPKAFEWVQDKGHMFNAEPFKSDEETNKAMVRLNEELRNQFAHFAPKGWGIEVRYIVQASLPGLKLLRHLAFSSGRVHWYEGENERIAAVVNAINERLLKEA